jgi:hypothetical protein
MVTIVAKVPKIREYAVLALSDGSAMKGYFFVEATVRIQDLLNGERAFLPFIDEAEQVHLVNKNRIVSIRPYD